MHLVFFLGNSFQPLAGAPGKVGWSLFPTYHHKPSTGAVVRWAFCSTSAQTDCIPLSWDTSHTEPRGTSLPLLPLLF